MASNNNLPSNGLPPNSPHFDSLPSSGVNAYSPPSSASFSFFPDPVLARNLQRATLFSRISIEATQELIVERLRFAPEFQHRNYILHWNQILIFDGDKNYHWFANLHPHMANFQAMCSRIENVGLHTDDNYRHWFKCTWFDAGFDILFVALDDQHGFEVRLRENLPSGTIADILGTNFANGANGANGTNGTNGWTAVNRVATGMNETDSDSSWMSSGMIGMDSDTSWMSSGVIGMNSDSPGMSSGMTGMDSDSPETS